VLWLAQALAAAGQRTIVAARTGEPLAERAAAAAVRVVPCNPLFEFDPVAALRLRRIIRREGVQVVHAHTGHAVALAAVATLGTDARMVLTRHVVFPLRSNGGTRWKYARADAIIAVSRAVAATLAEGGIDPTHVEIIPAGIDLTRVIVPSPREALAALGVPARSPLVVQVAQLTREKDPVTFVRAVAVARGRVPDLHALMVGDGPMRAAVEAAVAGLGLQGVVHLAGYRRDADALLAAADAVTLTSTAEGLPTVLIDALSLGKPVAATAAGGTPEVVEDGVSGLLAPVGDAERLGGAIVALLTEHSLTERLRAGALAKAEQFSVVRTAERTAAVYERVLAARE